MDERSFYALLRRTVALPVALLACLAAILVAEILLLSDSLRWLDHSDKVIATSRQAGRSIVEMDTNLRAYHLTRDNSFLAPYGEAKSRLPDELEQLRELTRDDFPQQARLRAVSDADERWMQWADEQLSSAQEGPPSSEALLAGNELIEQVRARQREFVAAEEAVRLRRSKRAEFLNAAVIASAVGLSLIIAVALFTLTRRELKALSSSYERHLQAETEHRQELTQSREWFQSTLNSLGEAVVSTDQSGSISYINPVAQQLTGWAYSEARGRKFGEVMRLLDERTRAPAEDPIALVIRTRQVMPTPAELLLTSARGMVRPIELTGAPILDRQNQVLGVTVVFRDVTQRRQTEQTLRSSERLTLAGRLSATIAHEIRNPLDTVSNLVYLLQREESSPVQAQYLTMAGEEVSRIAQITSQLLTFHRESRNPIGVNLTEVLESVLVLFAPQIRQNHVEVVKRFETGKSVRGFPGELRQVFSNLVGNAIEVIPPRGTLVLRVRESSLVSDPTVKGVRVTVLDSGAGIPAAVRKNLFAPFYTTKGEKGTGLGLWISRSIVEKHEGTIHFVSRTNNGNSGNSGTAFSVFLPFTQKLGLLDVKGEAPA
ncbi:MAG TPA: CHASE3 domain-containing protein [Bryocella sp.]|nr:CHASE3 domain-containing protein [Bryocella sp.]